MNKKIKKKSKVCACVSGALSPLRKNKKTKIFRSAGSVEGNLAPMT